MPTMSRFDYVKQGFDLTFPVAGVWCPSCSKCHVRVHPLGTVTHGPNCPNDIEANQDVRIQNQSNS